MPHKQCCSFTVYMSNTTSVLSEARTAYPSRSLEFIPDCLLGSALLIFLVCFVLPCYVSLCSGFFDLLVVSFCYMLVVGNRVFLCVFLCLVLNLSHYVYMWAGATCRTPSSGHLSMLKTAGWLFSIWRLNFAVLLDRCFMDICSTSQYFLISHKPVLWTYLLPLSKHN
jgi:hypothetical protein